MMGCEASNAQLRVLTSRGEYFATRFDANNERVQYTFEHKPEWIRLDFPGLDQTRTNINTCIPQNMFEGILCMRYFICYGRRNTNEIWFLDGCFM